MIYIKSKGYKQEYKDRDTCKMVASVSRQSANIFLQPSELDSPTPSHASECVPPPLWLGRGHTPRGEEMGVPLRARIDTAVLYSRYICTLTSRIYDPPSCKQLCLKKDDI